MCQFQYTFSTVTMCNNQCILFLLSALSWAVVSALRDCNPAHEFPCDDGWCVSSLRWCDGVQDCSDKSDERYCNGGTPCLDSHFPCRDGRCIPLIGLCNGYDDCSDGSDEDSCYSSVIEGDSGVNMKRGELTSVVTKAVEYLMAQKDADYDWGTFTPRAVVAMSFASRVSQVGEKELMRKQLNTRLLLDLMKKSKMSLGTLALYVNALYATCQDPRNFEGTDLVARLRRETDTAIRSNSTIPLAFLTLCIAGQMKQSDAYVLADMFRMEGFTRTGSRALMVMAMKCYTKTQDLFRNYMQHFFADDTLEMGDVYSKALFMQAKIAAGYKISPEELAKEQLKDGSFGDMLATYYAIPVLVNSSLLDLKCNGTIYTGMKSTQARNGGQKHVVYSVWISSGKDVNSHTLTIAFDDDMSLFEVMKIAEGRDSLFRFRYDEMDNGKMVYSIAGIPNDSESGKSWNLYLGKVNSVMVNSVNGLMFLPLTGVDKVGVKDKDHFVFWFKRDP